MSKSATRNASHLEAFLYMVPKKNSGAVAKNLKKFVLWFEKHGVRIGYYRLDGGNVMEGYQDIAATLSAGKDEDV